MLLLLLLFSLITIVRMELIVIRWVGIVLKISWFHPEPMNVWQTSRYSLLILDVLFTEEVQQRDLLHQYSIVEELPACDRIDHEANWIGQCYLRSH
uniref:Putative secreted protein n=1 Tax=Anopheles marajoara TaxID=58244 RepID=A0A2M4C974_9DIPT